MDYEKKYKEALNWMKDVYPTLEGAAKEDAEHYFPELKESEDERIINNIKKVIVWYRGMFTEKSLMPEEYQEINAWLEKQSKKVEPIESFNSEFERQISHLIASIINKEYEYTEAFIKWTSNAFLNYAKRELEKQGEQKSTNKVVPKFKIGDYVKNVNDKREPIYEIVYMDKECYICEYRGKERMGDKAVMHFAFDNPYLRLVEPKFKVGDWVVSPNGVYWHIDKISNSRYEVTSNTGESSSWNLDTNIYHKFTIQDAKDGDVLASKEGDDILIFRKIEDNVSFSSYYNIAKKVEHYWSKSRFVPATKEQRDQLEKAMADAGYTFDFEKKELKKIERKPAEWSEEDENWFNEVWRCVSKEYPLANSYIFQWLKNRLKSLKPQNRCKPSDEQIQALVYVFNHYIPNATDKIAWNALQTIELMLGQLLREE